MSYRIAFLAALIWRVCIAQTWALDTPTLDGGLRIYTEGGRVAVDWPGRPGYTYELEFSATLGSPWTRLEWSQDGAGEQIKVFLDDLVDPFPGQGSVRLLATENNLDSDGDGLRDAVDPTPYENTFAAYPEISGLVNQDATVRLEDGLWAVWTFDDATEVPLDPPNEYLSRPQYPDALGTPERTLEGESLSHGVGTPAPKDGIYTGSLAADWPFPSLGTFNSEQLGEDATISIWVKIKSRERTADRFALLSGVHKYGARLMELYYYPAWRSDTGQAKVEIFHTTLGLPIPIQHRDSRNVSEINPGLTLLDDDQWHHLVVSFAEEDSQVFIDGQSASGPFEKSFLSRPLLEKVDYLFVGGSVLVSDIATIDGCVDHMVVYDRVLNAEEVQALYNYDSDGDGVSNRDEQASGSDPYFYNP